MHFVYLTHALTSCWNHGNAHFQRGLLRSLGGRGHQVVALEPAESWSRANLANDQGDAAVQAFHTQFPDLAVLRYDDVRQLAAHVDDADVVIVHEWTDRAAVAELGRLRERGGRFTLLFHDTHHRAVSDPAAMHAFDLSGYDGVLAFGSTLAAIYERWGWRDRVFVFHEAADLTLFYPPIVTVARKGAVWIGNWGDGERSAELASFLFRPARDAGIELDVHGVRYPTEALQMLAKHAARYHGWIANAAVPDCFARHAFTVHVPRRYYSDMLPGIPTIRVFEALACGIPLICAPWQDSEGLFSPGADFLVARNGDEMASHMRRLVHEPALARSLAESGLARIRARHSCDIRADELLAIVARISDKPRALQGVG